MRNQAMNAAGVALGTGAPGAGQAVPRGGAAGPHGFSGAAQRFMNQQQQPYGDPMAAGGAPNNGPFFLGPSEMSIGDQAQRFMNPYQQNVIGGIRGEFDHLRGQAAMQSNQQATQAGAFGGSRAAIAQGARLGELDRAQASQIGNFLHQGYGDALQMGLGYSEYERGLRERQAQEPLFRQQQALNFMNLGMGPYGTTQSQYQPRNWMSGAVGGATAGAAFGPWGAAAGGVLGGLWG